MRILDFIISDDVRQEIGNKISVMGIYTDDLILAAPPQKWPVPFRIGVFVRVFIEETDISPNSFTLQITQEDKNVARMEGDIKVHEKSRYLTLPLIIFPLPIPGPGVLQFELALLNNDQKLLEELNSVNVKVA